MERVKKWCKTILRRSPQQEDEPDDAPKAIPIYFVFFFVLNYTIGTGYLGVPFVFFHAGIITGALTLLAVSLLCYVGAIWLIEAMARAQALETWKKEREKGLFKTGSITGGDRPLLPKFELTLHRKFEPSELCRIFLGIYGEYSYIAVLVINSMLICWACATVAGSSLASNISYNFGSLERCRDSDFHHRAIPEDGCKDSYRFSVFLYSVAVIPLCLLELTEQKYIQLLLGLFRFVIVGCMSIYSIIKLFGVDDYPVNYPATCANDTYGCDPNEILGDYDYWHEISRFGVKGWLTAIPVIFYAQLMHTSLSKLTHPVKEKRHLGVFMMTVFTTSGFLFLVVGVTVALWFKKDTEETCTLNFVYTAHHGSSTALKIFSYFIILSPVPDVYSAFPLAILVMKDNLFMVITGSDSVTGNVESEKNWTRRKKQVFLVVLSLALAVVPLLGSLLVANLVDITRYGGLLGFATACLYPAALQLKSQYDCNKAFCEAVEQSLHDNNNKGKSSSTKNETTEDEETPLIPEFPVVKYFDRKNPCYTTPYHSIFSHPYMVMFMSLFAVAAFGLTIASLPIRVHRND